MNSKWSVKTKYRGVRKVHNQEKYSATFSSELIGYFPSAEEAARAYDRHAKANTKEPGKLRPNFPEEA